MYCMILSGTMCRRRDVQREQNSRGSVQRRKKKDKLVWLWVTHFLANHLHSYSTVTVLEKENEFMNTCISFQLFTGGEREARARGTEEEAWWRCKEEESSHQYDTPVWWNSAEGSIIYWSIVRTWKFREASANWCDLLQACLMPSDAIAFVA